MQHPRLRHAAALFVLLSASVAQGPAQAATTDGSDGFVVYNENKILTEGEATTGYNLLKGVYLAEITSTGKGGGVQVQWTGATCPTASETHYYRNLCVLPTGGKLVISNPSQEWAGNETVTVLLKKLSATVTGLAKGFVVANEVQHLATAPRATSRSMRAATKRSSRATAAASRWSGTARLARPIPRAKLHGHVYGGGGRQTHGHQSVG